MITIDQFKEVEMTLLRPSTSSGLRKGRGVGL